MIKVRTPGKLFIAGEYAIREAGHTAILVGVNRLMDIEIEGAESRGIISSYQGESLAWTRENNQIILEEGQGNYEYILAAMEVVETYREELAKEPSYYQIKIVSQLEDARGEKYGLGSSSAVTVGLVEGLCQYYSIRIDRETLFKLSALANLRVNRHGSCGDIGAASYGGWIAYSSFDHKWVLDRLENRKISTLVEMDWPGLRIQELDPPKDMRLLVGWTGSAASTRDLLASLKAQKARKTKLYENFLEESKNCLDKMLAAFETRNLGQIKDQITKNGQLLAQLGQDFGLEVETPKLRTLSSIGQRHGGGAKLSGAGGGDCGIGIFHRDSKLERVIEEWEKAGIRHLDLKVHYRTSTNSG